MKKITSLILALCQAFGVWWRQLKAYQKVLVMIVGFVMLIVLLQLVLGTSPTQTTTPSTQPPEPTLALPPERLLRQLPHEEEGFVVAYNEPTQEYLITVTAPPYEIHVTKAYAWLAKQRITPETHTIRETWSRFKEYK